MRSLSYLSCAPAETGVCRGSREVYRPTNVKQQVKSSPRYLDLPSSCSCRESPGLQLPAGLLTAFNRLFQRSDVRIQIAGRCVCQPSTRLIGSSTVAPFEKFKRENWTARYLGGVVSPPTSLACDFGPSHSLTPTFNELDEGEEKQSSRILLFPVTYDEDHVDDFRQGGCKCLIGSADFLRVSWS